MSGSSFGPRSAEEHLLASMLALGWSSTSVCLVWKGWRPRLDLSDCMPEVSKWSSLAEGIEQQDEPVVVTVVIGGQRQGVQAALDMSDMDARARRTQREYIFGLNRSSAMAS